MKKALLLSLLFFSFISTAQDFNTFLKNADVAVESGNFRKARENATKALELNPNSLEARWIRSRTLLLSNSTSKDFENAIIDLNFMIGNGGATAKVYKALGLAESQLANSIFRFKKAKENKGFTDDTSSIKNEQKQYYNEAILHYKNSKIAYQKAAEISEEEKENSGYRYKEIESAISEVETKIKELK